MDMRKLAFVAMNSSVMMMVKNPSLLVDTLWEKAKLRDSEPNETKVKWEFAVMMMMKSSSTKHRLRKKKRDKGKK